MYYKRNVTSGKILSGTDGEIRNYCHTKMGLNKFIDKITNRTHVPFHLKGGKGGLSRPNAMRLSNN